MTLIVLKYLTWFLSVGTAFVGAWFFEFTITDKDTNRRSLTQWGKRAIIVAGLALILALPLQIATDAAASRSAEKLDERLTDIQTLLNKFANADPEAAKATVASLESTEDFRAKFPEDYARITSAQSFHEVRSIVEAAWSKEIQSRISTENCTNLPLTLAKGSIFPSHVFQLTADPTVFVRLMVTNEEVEFELNSAMSVAGMKSGYKVILGDTAKPISVACGGFSSESSCETSSTKARSAYTAFQKKAWREVRVADKSFELDKERAEELRRTMACIAP